MAKSVEEAIIEVFKQAHTLPIESLPLSSSLLGRILAEDIISKENFPPFPASIMDGYAVVAPLEPDTYPLAKFSKLAGKDAVTLSSEPGSARGDLLEAGVTSSSSDTSTTPSEVVYITTGAPVPNGYNAVIQVEETERFTDSNGKDMVKIKKSVEIHENIRKVGSDMHEGELILRKLTTLNSSDLGLLATCGILNVNVYKKPVIGVMSTGNEVVDFAETSIREGQIRDSNRISLISSFITDGYEVKDLGILPDNYDKIKEEILLAGQSCDIIVTSGGVSMGAADFVKPIIREIGTIFFEKLDLKPGKPTTFGTFNVKNKDNIEKKIFFYGLPGNPVSCYVTKFLFINPLLKKLQGITSSQCLPTQIPIRYIGKNLKRDSGRVEYQRISIYRASSGKYKGELVGETTGFQRSSRLLSVREAHGLIRVLPGKEDVKEGEMFEALLLSTSATNLLSPPSSSISLFPLAALFDEGEKEREEKREKEREEERNKVGDGQDYITCTCCSNSSIKSFYSSLTDKKSAPAETTTSLATSLPSLPPTSTHSNPPPVTSSSPQIIKPINSDVFSTFSTEFLASKNISSPTDWRIIRTAILTISDRASQGVYQDLSGPEMEKQLSALASIENYPVVFHIVARQIVSDDPAEIKQVVENWTSPLREEAGLSRVDFILTSGGTGFGLRDTTPETIRALLHRESPGISQALLNEGLRFTPLALLSRPVSGTRYASFIATLPGRYASLIYLLFIIHFFFY